MKKLLLIMMCAPVMLAAQNGVTVSNFAVNAGTVTFNVSWNRDAMPVTLLWSDSVWVFVDYNKNGVMTRLPVADATASAGTVTKISGNDQGVRVIGNARTNGSFSATVRLFTTETDVASACAYASNYPPVGKYNTSATGISFTGTPMYEISLAHSGGGSVTVKSGDTFLLPCDYTLESFTDATGAPGILKCIPMTGDIDFIVPTVSKNMQASFVVNSTIVIPNPALLTYSWSASDFSPATYEGTTFTSTMPEIPGTYAVTLTAHREDYCDLVKIKEVEVSDCTAPGQTINFTAFSPCSYDTTGAYWYLTDTRESNNVQTYKVKMMADGHIWMVQDMKFGDKCTKTTFSGSSGADQIGKVTSLTDKTYYGDCSNARVQGAGYYYDLAAAINKSRAYRGSGVTVGCSGTGSSANACQGICPLGWHIPTGDPTGEIAILRNSPNFCANTADCWLQQSAWEGVASGLMENCSSFHSQSSNYWTGTSTDCNGDSSYAYRLGTQLAPEEYSCNSSWAKCDGYTVRCIMNY